MDIEKLSFEDSYKELSELVKKMEQGELTLEESIIAYEKGKALKDCCEKILKNAESKISIISDKEV